MGNCKSNTVLGHKIVDLTNEKEVLESLLEVLSCDADLTENEDYFSDDTLELGYESEADRIVQEYISKKGVPKTVKSYTKAFEKILSKLGEQEFWGECESSIIEITKDRVSVSYFVGGSNGSY